MEPRLYSLHSSTPAPSRKCCWGGPLCFPGSSVGSCFRAGCVCVLGGRGRGWSVSGIAASHCLCPGGPVSMCPSSFSPLIRDLAASVLFVCQAHREISCLSSKSQGAQLWNEMWWRQWLFFSNGVPDLCMELVHLVNKYLWAHSLSQGSPTSRI